MTELRRCSTNLKTSDLSDMLIFSYFFRFHHSVENGELLFGGGRDSGVDGADEEEWVSDTEVR